MPKKINTPTGFKLLASAKVNGTIPVFKYESTETGLKIVLAQVEGPLVNGYFTLATEAHDDDGLPHTLEHLIFLGSDLYPFKGVLDLLANRCLASGTNAWTDTDHTCYTMTTAGKDGFLELLPIYLDHVLHPTLTEAGFITEVHHVSGDGEDGGVVYCEMQGRENTGESLSHYNLMRLAYPNCGYSSETGGIMHNLRTTTNNEKIRAYHADFYRAENLTVIIAGQIGIDEVVAAIAPVERDILARRQVAVAEGRFVPFVRPWQTPVEPLEQSQNVAIVFPSDEEDCGIVSVGWRGPLCTAENLKLTACSVLLRYLSDTAVSPLQREFVEIADPYAAQITYSMCENLETFLSFTFESVPIEKIDAIPEKLQEVLRAIVEGREEIDMVRMKSILERNVLEYLNNLEGNPHEAVAFLSIADALYGNTAEDFDQRLNVNKQLELLLAKKDTFWRQLLKQYLIDGHSVIVRAAPSIEEQQRMSAEEIERIDRQICQLGPEGLAAKADALAAATEENGRVPPNEMLTQVPIPSPDSIRFHPLRKWQAGVETHGEGPAGFSLDELPCYAEAYDVHTNFVYMIVTMNTEHLTAAQRPLLFLLLDLITESPVSRTDGTQLTYEQVVTALERDTIAMGTYIGLESASQFSCGPFSDTCTLTLQVEPRKYALGVQWIADLLHRTQFTAERVRVCASKITNAVSQARRKGHAVASELLKAMYYRSDSNVRCSSMLRQQKYLNQLLEQLDSGDEPMVAGILATLNAVRAEITRPQNVAVHLAADWQRIGKLHIDLTGPWSQLAGDQPPATADEKRLAVRFDYKLFRVPVVSEEEAAALAEQAAAAAAVALGGEGDAEPMIADNEVSAGGGEQPPKEPTPPAAPAQPAANAMDAEVETGVAANSLLPTEPELTGDELQPEAAESDGTVVGMGSIESAFMYHSTASICDFNHPDLPALMLFLQYLTQLEGPLWRQIRGQGFAYGYNLMARPSEASLLFSLYRATNVVAAYKETKAIVDAQLTESAVWDATLLESAKSSLIFEMIEREKNVGDLVVQALLGSFKRVEVDYNQRFVRRINEVQVEDLRRVGEKYVAKLFGRWGEARTAIVCHPDKVQDVQAAFADLGRTLAVAATLEESVLGQ